MFEGLFVTMATNLPSYFPFEFLEQLEVSGKLYFVEICSVSEVMVFFNLIFGFRNFGFNRSLLSLLKLINRVEIAY